ncbi:Mannosyltransferase [hydrothermal vent metagenome]|uniref:Mannosyltransferase n=1 Tax=hydrothermal vent metagenome TaxID=652676 RepID=A0A3B0UAW5_9ZZZZ
MRIGFEAKRLFLNDRGLGNYARNLLYGLLKYAPNHNYHLFTPQYSDKHINQEYINSKCVTIHKPSGLLGAISKSAWRSLGMGKDIKRNKIDVFHGLAQELPKDIKKSGAKSIVTIHDLIFLKHPEFYKPIDRKIYFSKVKFAVNNTDHIIAISEQTKSDIINTFSVPENKISIIYQSCNEVFYEKRTQTELEQVKTKWDLPKNYILYVGALNENKNVKVILEALNLLKGKFDLPLVIVGKGEAYKKQLIEYATKNNLLKQLIFASDVADPTPLDLSSFYQLSSVFVFPSFYEGFGIPILEARFSGTPVIASNSSCLEESGGGASKYFDPSNAEELAAIIKNHTSNPSAKKISNNLTLKGSTNKLLSIYNTI